MGLVLDFTLEARPDPVMPFGVHMGTRISELPRGYLEMVIDMKVDDELRSAIIGELSARLNVA